MLRQKNIENYKKFNCKYKKIMYIAFFCDENYVLPVSIMLESLIQHNSDAYIVFYSVGDGLSENTVQKFKKIIGTNGELRLSSIPLSAKNIIAQLPLPNGHLASDTIYYRLFLPYIVDNDVDRILYLDSDILIRGELRELYQLDFEESMIAGVTDCNAYEFMQRLQLKIYVNSGVLLMNVLKIRSYYTLERMIDKLLKIMSTNYVFGDQDIINELFAGKVKLLPIIYNNHYMLQKRFILKNLSVMNNTIIAHFIGPIKPWKKEYYFYFTREYYKYLSKYLNIKQKLDYWLYKPIIMSRNIFCLIRKKK